MDARVNVNIDVFVLNFYWTDLQGEKKKYFKTYYFFLFEHFVKLEVLVCVQM